MKVVTYSSLCILEELSQQVQRHQQGRHGCSLVRETVISILYRPKWEAGLEKEAETPPQKFTFNLGGIWIS